MLSFDPLFSFPNVKELHFLFETVPAWKSASLFEVQFRLETNHCVHSDEKKIKIVRIDVLVCGRGNTGTAFLNCRNTLVCPVPRQLKNSKAMNWQNENLVIAFPRWVR